MPRFMAGYGIQGNFAFFWAKDFRVTQNHAAKWALGTFGVDFIVE